MLFEFSDWIPKQHRLRRKYKGHVIYNKDPKGIGRIKCVIEGVLEGDIEHLPWVTIQNSPGFGSTTFAGFRNVIELDSEVVIEFLDGSVYHPICVGYWSDLNSKTGMLDSNYPNKYGFRDKTGLEFEVDMVQKSLRFAHPSGFGLTLREKGDCLLKIPTNLSMHIEGKADFKVNGDVLANVMGSMLSEVNGNRINITKKNHWDRVYGMHFLYATKGAIRQARLVAEALFETYTIDTPTVFQNTGLAYAQILRWMAELESEPAYVANQVESEPTALWSAPTKFKPGWEAYAGSKGKQDEESLDRSR